ncbi:hypothetical protein TRP8649_00749 [Pelagimonas phthalicica]|uniref:Uncharacterized protein n=1 Tax=Pelagimonas phthalicica TaxID=1037362 RepID=A0A238J8W0_9RHOB|nr:hypothetical protein [Pelagimonas phthalicica]TDS94807.1 hypothetical protein CLV87_1322 [Pelagimonas phthalicica]SMX26664.1 hypothetical protein TRP8649_00749 [Pelagimonas phthalicica]
MIISKVEYTGFRDIGPGGCMRGSVSLVAGETRINVPLTLPRKVEIDKSQHRLLLLAEALRQTRRMPEYRRKGSLKLAPELMKARKQA